jgi:anaerobic magnesium-protoporphyrin IX monomethyl ester cyclase
LKKILFINPNKWGRGITPIWIASHFSILKKNFEIELFDATFYENWTKNETKFNTHNQQYLDTNYLEKINFIKNDVYKDLEKKIIKFNPDIIFWSAISSHIHGEGEYVNIQYGYELLEKININNSILITGGLQATASPEFILGKFPKIDYLISGESEFVLNEILKNLESPKDVEKIPGLSFVKDNKFFKNKPQKIISNLDEIPHYDYSLFDDQVFLRPYNGSVLNALDYEMSRGCIYTCSYCVETVIQNYYNFKLTSKKGALLEAKKYLRNKSSIRIYEELKIFKDNLNINLVRCQDTNFLTINKKILIELSELLAQKPLDLKLYIETRPEGINQETVKILKNLGVDGVGMGIELSGEEFRENNLNRFSNQKKIIEAFDILKDNGIKRTSYNIIGLPGQNEQSIINTIEFNKLINPDNVTVAYYSPYLGTNEQKKSVDLEYFEEYEKDVDGQLRSLSNNTLISRDKLDYYKKNFNNLIFSEKK